MINRFFLADDDTDDSDLFQEALTSVTDGIEITVSRNGQELIAKLKENDANPHIIFLDINMPVMNGWECLDNLKKEDNLKDIPVIMYSTSSAAIFGKRAVLSGALGFYEKPTSFKELQDFLKIISESKPDDLKQTLKELQASKVYRFLTD